MRSECCLDVMVMPPCGFIPNEPKTTCCCCCQNLTDFSQQATLHQMPEKRRCIETLIIWIFCFHSFKIKRVKKDFRITTKAVLHQISFKKYAKSWVRLRGPVIQANGRLTFEDDLRSGGLLCFISMNASVRTELADSMVTPGEPGGD